MCIRDRKEIDWETFRDDIPAPAVFIVREEDGRPVFEETGITRKYLSRSPERPSNKPRPRAPTPKTQTS